MKEYSKKIKRLMRKWLAEAYERELHRELVRLDTSMAAWRKGEIGSGEMNNKIYEWQVGPARALYKHYNSRMEATVIAIAIALGILDESELPPELLEAIKNPIMYFRSLKDANDLRTREGNWWKN